MQSFILKIVSDEVQLFDIIFPIDCCSLLKVFGVCLREWIHKNWRYAFVVSQTHLGVHGKREFMIRLWLWQGAKILPSFVVWLNHAKYYFEIFTRLHVTLIVNFLSYFFHWHCRAQASHFPILDRRPQFCSVLKICLKSIDECFSLGTELIFNLIFRQFKKLHSYWPAPVNIPFM